MSDLHESDLRWLVRRNPRAASSPDRWNVHLQRDTRVMLDGAGVNPR